MPVSLQCYILAQGLAMNMRYLQCIAAGTETVELKIPLVVGDDLSIQFNDDDGSR